MIHDAVALLLVRLRSPLLYPTWGRWATVLVAGTCAALGGAVPAKTVAAHPLGNFTVNHYSRVELHARGISIRYVLDLAEIPSVQETRLADTDHDSTVSAEEWQAYKDRRLEDIRRNLALSIDDTPVQLQTAESTLSTPLGEANIPLVRIDAWFQAVWSFPPGDSQPHRAVFRDPNDTGRIGWREIIVRADPEIMLSQSTAPAIDITDELHSYPENFQERPLSARDASWVFAAGVVESTPVVPSTAAGPGRPVDPFTALVTEADLNFGVALLALLSAAVLGGIHAASPGHGKTVMAAYIVGTRGSFLHAIVLALSVTVSHTTGVLVLAVITLVASTLIVPDQLYPWLTLVAAFIVLGLGATLFVGAVRGVRLSPRQYAHAHSHEHHHSHLAAEQHSHSHTPPRALPITWRALFALGLAGGIVPSASALVVLLSALALGRLGFGLILIVAFGIGMAAVLTLTGVLLVYASRFMAHYFPDTGQSPLQRRLARSVPVLSAGVMLLIGVVATVQALGQFGLVSL